MVTISHRVSLSVIDKIHPIPSDGKFSPTIIDKALANRTNMIRSRCLVTIVLGSRTLPLEGIADFGGKPYILDIMP